MSEELRELAKPHNRVRIAGHTVELVRHAARNTDGSVWSAYLLEDDQPLGDQRRTRADLLWWLRSPDGRLAVTAWAERA